MATFNLVLTYPDGQQARILAAVKDAAATPVSPTPSNAEAIEWFRQLVTRNLKTLVVEYERKAAIEAAAATAAPDVT